MTKMNVSTKKIISATTASVLLSYAGRFKPVKAQDAISLSVTPPLWEVVLPPGKEVLQAFTVTNMGGNTVVTPKIVYFEPDGLEGNVKLTTKEAPPSWIKYDKQPVLIESGQSKDFRILISPSKDEPQTDHTLSLVFETNEATDLLNQTAVFHKAGIGSNILLTISKNGNPNKAAKIDIFTAPKAIDSLFGKLDYKIVLKNTGDSFWKPNGNITINGKKTLKIAPQNVLAGHKREISCLDGETIKNCNLEKPFIGINKARLEFTLDNSAQVYSAEVSTFSFPFSIILIILILSISTLIIHYFRKQTKKKKTE